MSGTSEVAVDASTWVRLLMPDDPRHAVTLQWLGGWVNNGGTIVAPTLLLAEVAGAVSRQTGQSRLGREALNNVLTNRAVRLVPMDASLAEAAAELAADLRLRGADAVYVAVARRFGVPLVTWDQEQLQRAGAVITTRTPDAA